MARQPSIAVYYHANMNPRTSETDRKAVEIIEALKAKGFNFKQIAVDAILRAQGVDPIAVPQNGLTTVALEDLLTRFADQIISEIKSTGGSIRLPDVQQEDEGNGKASPFAKRFAKSFANRQQDGE